MPLIMEDCIACSVGHYLGLWGGVEGHLSKVIKPVYYLHAYFKQREEGGLKGAFAYGSHGDAGSYCADRHIPILAEWVPPPFGRCY